MKIKFKKGGDRECECEKKVRKKRGFKVPKRRELYKTERFDGGGETLGERK